MKGQQKNDKPHEDNIQLGIEIFRDKLSRQSDDQGLIETKIGILAGFISIYLVTLLAMIIEKPSLISNQYILLGLSFGIIALLLFIFALWPRKYKDPPDSEVFYDDKSLTRPNYEVKKQLLSDYVDAYESNSKNNADKISYFKRGLATFFISIIILFVGLLTFNTNTSQDMQNEEEGAVVVPPSSSSGNQVEKGNGNQNTVVTKPNQSSGNTKELSE